MSKIEYAFAQSGATLIRVNEQDRVCLTRTIQNKQPELDMGNGWQAAHNIITSSCEIRHAHTAIAAGKSKGSFLLKIQELERAETRNTSKPKSYGEYDGTEITRADMLAEFPDERTDEEKEEAFSAMRGTRGYTPRTYNNGYMNDMDSYSRLLKKWQREW